MNMAKKLNHYRESSKVKRNEERDQYVMCTQI